MQPCNARTGRNGAAEVTQRQIRRNEGVHGTPIPGWKSFSDAQTWDLVAFLLSEAH